MGADLIGSFLWVRLGPDGEPALDWEEGRRAVDRLVDSWTPEEAELASRWNEEDDGRSRLQEGLQALRDSLDGRDVDWRAFADCGFYYTAGLSWGDFPTEAYWVWTQWGDEEFAPRGREVLAAVGFLDDVYGRSLLGESVRPQEQSEETSGDAPRSMSVEGDRA